MSDDEREYTRFRDPVKFEVHIDTDVLSGQHMVRTKLTGSAGASDELVEAMLFSIKAACAAASIGTRGKREGDGG